MANASPEEFLKKFGADFARIARGHSDEDREGVLAKTIDMHRRHGRAVIKMLGDAIRENSFELAEQAFPSTSLVRTWLGSGDLAPDEPPQPAASSVGFPIHLNLKEEPVDYVPEPGDPLRVAFINEGKRHAVVVEGLGRVSGAPARVPHALRAYLEEDRAAGRAPRDCQYVHLETISELSDLGADAPRQYVRRCRKELARNYREIYGRDPNAPLLIQNKMAKGHRLDPTIVIVESPE